MVIHHCEKIRIFAKNMADHKLVYKNTLFLSIRVFLSMAIGLYTSRVILYELGVIDFGIYSVVGSLSMVFGYLNYSVASSIQRFMSCEIAVENDYGLQKCFSTALLTGIYLSFVVVFLCESVGLWALDDIIDIPLGREFDAQIVYQAAVLILVIEIFKSCCLALIIAEEQMSILAYIYIAESILKLVIVFLLELTPGNKLLVYAFLLVGVSLLSLFAYIIMCRRKFPKVHFRLKGGSERIKEIFSFTGWNVLASFADVCIIQGANIVLNVFYGVAYNATIGITNQVKQAVYSFSKNVQAAANPHLTKEFARGEFKSFSSSVVSISVVSFVITFLLGLPVLLNTQTILNIWLINIPPAGAIFIRLMITFCIIDSLVGPMWTSMQAYGKIRTYQIIITVSWFLSIPAMWLTLKFGALPESVLKVQIIFDVLILAIRVIFGVKYCHINLRDYLCNTVLRILAIVVVGGFLPFVISLCMTGVLCLVVSTFVSFLSVPTATLLVGFPKAQRVKVLTFIRNKLPFKR